MLISYLSWRPFHIPEAAAWVQHFSTYQYQAEKRLASVWEESLHALVETQSKDALSNEPELPRSVPRLTIFRLMSC